jgi:signal-transduction protein with cAMP-binding, CBS, and nucleotidyltransferase domain
MAHTFVKDVMNKGLVTVDSTTTIKDAAKLMDKQDVGCVIVLRDSKPIGIITERDFVKRIAVVEKPLSSPVSDVMSSPLISMDADETIWEAAQIMKTKNIHKLPIKEGEKIIGIVTTSDIVKTCSVGSDSEMRRICDQILMRMQNNP